MNIIIAGVQGSGKGTHGKMLSEKLTIPHISMGDTIYKHLVNNTGIANPYTINDYNSGTLAPDSSLFNIADYELKPSRVKNGFILDGFPRTKGQNDYVINNFNIDICIYLTIPNDVAIDRLMNRGRVDDTESGIKHRLNQFKTITEPIFDYYREENRIVEINTNQSIEDSFKEILEKVTKKIDINK